MSPQEKATLAAEHELPVAPAPEVGGDIVAPVAPWLSDPRLTGELHFVGVPAVASLEPNVAPAVSLPAATPAPTQWVIETEAGDIVPLPGDDITIGRQPKATADSTPLALNDATKTLSKTHARLRRDASRDTWTVEDLASTNGVAVVTRQVEHELQPNVVTPLEEYVAFGMLRCRVIRI